MLIELLLCISRTSQKEILYSISVSMLNLMFKVSSTLLMEVNFIKQIVLSTYLFHSNMSLDNVDIVFRSRSTIKMYAKTGELIATPSTWRYVLLLRAKCRFLVQLYNNSSISFFFWYISIYFLLIINTFVISIVSYKRTLVNSETTSNDTILYSRGIVILWSPFVNVLLFLIVNCDSLNGFRSWARYLAKSYVAVLILEMIGLSGRCSSVLLFETLCSLAVR